MKEHTVYMHISPSNKRYIGITSQKNVNKRWQNGGGYKTNTHFWRAICKYGWDNFQHIIIARGLDEETAKWLEIELIREWDSTNKIMVQRAETIVMSEQKKLKKKIEKEN